MNMGPAKLSAVTVSMGRLEHLKQTVPLIVSQDGIELVVVDYSCPEGSGHWVRKEFPNARVCFIEGQRFFNLSKARNSGVRATTGERICILDADVKVDSRFGNTIFPILERNTFFRHPKIHVAGYNGFVVCRREDFEAAGGYDERCEGY